ncbi:hypothetical protein [Ignicoccus islandicus]|uniref:hypothetical protein n=1 Tax=Ignicoccus islandicus TaxID=54259 RepID=UPI0009464378|nr:hypothetical protein [Ignicoccus islandicus]
MEDVNKEKKPVDDVQEEVINKLEKIYEDDEIVLLAAPDDIELEQLILNILQEKRMKFKELKEVFSATAGEDRLRRALLKLLEENRIFELPDGSYTANPEELAKFQEEEVPQTTEEEIEAIEDILGTEEEAEEEAIDEELEELEALEELDEDEI